VNHITHGKDTNFACMLWMQFLCNKRRTQRGSTVGDALVKAYLETSKSCLRADPFTKATCGKSSLPSQQSVFVMPESFTQV